MDYTSRKDAAPTAKRRPKDAIAADCRHSVGLKSDGTVIATGDNKYGQCDANGWRGIRLSGG